MKMPRFDTPEQVLAAQRIVEEETAERFLEFGDAFELHGNTPAGELFSELGQEASHRASTLPANAAPPRDFSWPLMEDIVVEQSMLHYLMGPYQVLEVAIEAMQRALGYFEKVHDQAAPGETQAHAREVVDAFSAQLETLRQRLQATPPPEPGWNEDLDPPNFDVE